MKALTQPTTARPTRAFTVIALALLLAGCASPPRPLLPGGRRTYEAHRRAPEVAITTVPAELDLKTAKLVAMANNRDLEAASQRVEQAAARVRQAHSAWMPTVDANASAIRQFEAASISGAFVDPPYSSYGADLTVSWLVYDGMARRFRELAAEHGRGASLKNLEDARRLLAQGVAETFYGILLAEAEMAIAQADAAFNAELLEETRKRMRADKASRVEELNFMIRVNNARVAVLRARESAQTLRLALADLLGVTRFPAETTLVMDDVAAPDEDFDALVKTALARRPDAQALEAQIAAAREGVNEVIASYYPQVNATGSYGFQRFHDVGFGSDDDEFAVGVSATWRLFDGALRDARQEETWARMRELEAQLERLRIGIENELRQEATRIAVARELLTVQEETTRLTRESRDRERQRYNVGRASLTRLNEVQTDLVRAEGQLALSRLGLLQRIENLRAAAGTNLPGEPTE